jgi:single-strand DNA-binding protein
MSGVNKVILVGRLGQDPQIKSFDGGKSVASFSLATSESYKDNSGGRKEVTEWHNITAWNGLANISAKYLHKGDLVYIEGKLRNRSYDDKNGVKRYVTEVVAETLNMLGSKPASNGTSAAGDQPAEAEPAWANA